MRRRAAPTVFHRRRRVLLALVGLNGVELAGVALVGPGFWIGFSVSFALLLADLVYLRRQALADARRRRIRRRRSAWIAAEQAAVRREHARRAAARAAERETLLRHGGPDTASARHDPAEHAERYRPRSS